MSSCFIGLNRNVWQKAFILGKRGALLPRSGTALARSTHNSLYQMVKKRTLEAHKSKSSQYPNNHPSANQTKQYNLNNKSPNLTISMKNQDEQRKVCDNTEVLRATQFSCGTNSIGSNPSKSKLGSITCYPEEPEDKADICHDNSSSSVEKLAVSSGMRQQAICPPNSQASSNLIAACSKQVEDSQCKTKKSHPIICKDKINKDPPSCSPPPTDYKKLLFALAAGLGLGGLIWWLLFGRPSETDPKPEPIPVLKSSDLPSHVPYLLIGGGTASFSAFRSIKSNDPTAKVLMITNESRNPYMRPPLSKELWYSAHNNEISKDYRFKQWTGSERSLYFEPDEFFVAPQNLMNLANGGVAVAHGFVVKSIDPQKKVATLCDGYEISYDECLIATGCSPKNLHIFQDAPPSVRDKVMVYRTPEDFERLKQYADEKKSITIIGNGFIGSELACSLANYGKEKGIRLYQVFQESGNMSKIIPDYLSRWTMRKVESLGVCVVPNAKIRKAERDESQLKLHLNNGQTILTDIAVVCVGCDPNTKLAKSSGLEVDGKYGGFLVNAELEARRHLFVAGDASCFYDPLLGRRRVEHHDHSVVSGKLAGENMVGLKKPYTHQSMFWSDLGPEIGYEGIGLVDASLPTIGVFALQSQSTRSSDNLTENKTESLSDEELPLSNAADVECPEVGEDYGRGVIFYLKNDIVVGVLLWNVFNRIGLARTIIKQNKKYDDLNEVAKLFEIHA